jgi:hypothetical protein
MNFPNDETGQVLSEMYQSGIDLTQQHDVVFFHLFEQQEQAQAMADFINETLTDVKVSLQADDTPNVWDLNCTLVMVPSYENILAEEVALEKIATKFAGYSDGWGIEA